MAALSTQVNGYTPAVDAPAVQGQTSKIQPGDVGWQFVPQY